MNPNYSSEKTLFIKDNFTRNKLEPVCNEICNHLVHHIASRDRPIILKGYRVLFGGTRDKSVEFNAPKNFPLLFDS